MLKTLITCEQRVLRNSYGLSCGLLKKFSTDAEPKVSYIHKVGSVPMKFETIGQVLKQSAIKYPDRLALISCMENSQVTFAETLSKADRLASGLLNLGLQKGDCVAIWAPSYEFWYISNFAIARAGLIGVPLNPAYQLPELDYSLKKVDVKAIIIPETFLTQKYYEMLDTLIPSLRNSGREIQDNNVNALKHVIVCSDKKFPGSIAFKDLFNSSESDVAAIEKLQPSISPDSVFNIQFTSGTTGKPKAAAVSHFSLVNNGYDTGRRVGLDKEHLKICSNMPFFHVAGLMSIMNTLTYGASLVIPAPHFHAEATLKALVSKKCNGIYGSPSMYVDMVTKQKDLKFDLHEIDFAAVGAAICTPKLVKDSMKYLNIKSFGSIYGMTETSAAGFQTIPEEGSEVTESYVGKVADNLEVKTIDRDGNAVPFGQPGELCIRGYCTMLGYWNDPESTKEYLGADKWLKTGDQFILYENGYGKIVGRLKEMIIRGGENIFPREIEDFLNTHPNVLECHVIGIPEERLGEEVGAFIKLKDETKPITKDDVKDFCKGKLSHFKIPRFVFVVKNYPLTTSGKIQKTRFLEYFADQIKKSQ